MKKVFSVLIALVLLVNLLPLSTALADTKYVEVVARNAAIRDDYYDTGNVLAWVSWDTRLRVIDSKTNWYLNKWYKVEYDTGYSCVRGWIYSGDVAEHTHRYQEYYYNGNKFGVCTSCGAVSVEQTRTVEMSRAEALAAALPAAGVAAGADGPIPVGDIVGLFILGLAAIEVGMNPSTYQVKEWADTVDMDEFVREKDTCSNESFYKVQRAGNLVKIDNICMNTFQAFVCSRFMGIDVWTMSPEAAIACGMLNLGRFFGPERDAGQPDHYYHYHYGTDHNNMDASTHIFFGQTDSGLVPTSY